MFGIIIIVTLPLQYIRNVSHVLVTIIIAEKFIEFKRLQNINRLLQLTVKNTLRFLLHFRNMLSTTFSLRKPAVHNLPP